MSTGYKTITPIQIGNLLHILAAGDITWITARVWFACLEMVAIREAAQRVRRLTRDKRQVEPLFKRTELMELTGLNVRARSTAARDPVRVFVDIVRKRRWNHVTQAHEEEGRRQFKDAPVSPRTPDGRCAPIGAVLKSLIAQGRPGQGIERCGSLPAFCLGVDWSHGRQDHFQSKSMRRTSVHPRNEDSGERRS